MAEGTIWLRREGDGLAPIDLEGRQLMGLMAEGALVMVSAKNPRNPRQHRLLFKLARLVFENSDDFDSAEHVVEQIKIGTGLTDRTLYNVPGVGDVWQVRGQSIAFESMSQSKFAAWFELALDYVVAELLPGISRQSVIDHIEKAIAPTPQRRGR